MENNNKSMLRRVGIIGCLADGYDMFDGQTVSTRAWRNEIKNISKNNIVEVDTYEYKKNVFKIVIKLAKCLLLCSDIVIMLSGDGLKALLPVMYYSKKVLHKKIYHRVIGGELDTFIDRNPECKRYLNELNVNWVQSPNLVEKLKNRGVVNASFLENFRRIEPLSTNEVDIDIKKPYKFCTFCRVSESKGIGVAINAIKNINKKFGNNTVLLDIYGPIEPEFADEFHGLIKNQDDITYKGSVPSEQAVSILKDYYMHLFPTTWSGEGFPGALIDCYNAALPTIATDWAYNAEYIKDGKTGFLYNWHNHELLTEKIEYAINHQDEVYCMRNECLKEAKKYTADEIMKKVLDYMVSCEG